MSDAEWDCDEGEPDAHRFARTPKPPTDYESERQQYSEGKLAGEPAFDKPPGPVRFRMKEMTAEEAGKFLRQMAEMTAAHSQNWDNFQEIAASMFTSALEAGRAFGKAERDTPASPA